MKSNPRAIVIYRLALKKVSLKETVGANSEGVKQGHMSRALNLDIKLEFLCMYVFVFNKIGHYQY